MLFHYTCVSQDGTRLEGDIESLNFDTAVTDLQKRGLTVVKLDQKQDSVDVGGFKFAFKKKIEQKDIVIFSRQIATLFEAGVSALKAFRLLAVENDNPTLREELTLVADDIERGTSLSAALQKHPNLFSPFYVNMVRSGEESGKLNEVFLYLADYLDREYELRQKTKKALTYPAFVIATFFIIMIVMFVFIIPKMSAMFAEQGAELPLVTRIVLGISNFFVDYGLIMLPIAVAAGFFFYRYSQTPEGGYKVDGWKLQIPVMKNLYQKTFLARLADNMNTMLTSGVPIIRSIEITAEVVDNLVYRELLLRVANKVQNGTAFSKALYEEDNIPNILIQMVRIGEETGELGYILKNLATFYKREVDTAIDSVIGLIEPAMIVGLGLGVGALVASVLLPMYSLSSAIA